MYNKLSLSITFQASPAYTQKDNLENYFLNNYKLVGKILIKKTTKTPFYKDALVNPNSGLVSNNKNYFYLISASAPASSS
jgi:hypothetical protein